ncbi:MAG TPA: NADP-dependent oxidoreductase [Mycobacteriales bacterium]|jgi:NADPH:quinone reductase-like Zn-dependent oxidoreductase|nr:NADP-dependent oxidoreductase [Mycobacteriales bacterium]
MKAVRFHEYGGVETLRYEDVEQPTPGPGQVLVRVAATTFNPVDATIRSGVVEQIFPVSLPHTPGLDLSGTIAELGAGVQGLAVGDKVVGFLPMTAPGAAADYVVAPAEVLAPAPTTIPLADAAALPVAGLTAYQALFEQGGLKAGQRILVNGAGGGVGSQVVQLAKQAGATVIATASARSADAVKANGADVVVDYTATPVAQAVTEPVDLVVNLVPGAPADIGQLTRLVVDGGAAVTLAPIPLDDDPDRGVRWAFFNVRSDAAQLAELAGMVDKGELTLDIGGRYPIADSAAVQADGQAGKLRGRVLLIPAG